MTSTVRRAAAFASVGTLSLVVPLAWHVADPALKAVVATGPYLLVALLAVGFVSDGAVFELFARPGDRRNGRLYGLGGFALGAAGLAILAVQFSMPAGVYVGTVLLLSFGNLGGHVVRSVRNEPVVATAGFVTAGFLAGTVGYVVAGQIVGVGFDWPVVAFLAASGALLAALLREVLFRQDDPLVLVVVGLLLWLFASFPLEISTTRVAVALGVTVALGYVSYALETASLPGMLTGVFLGLLTIVLGDYGWFVMLIAFFGIGGLSSKFRYEEKLARGIAQENEGARGSGNVLANSLVAIVAVLAWAGSGDLGVPGELFFFAFAGSVAAALSDTLSSEIGGLYDDPRLITNFEVVEPGTDGAITWQGQIAGLAGATVIASIGYWLFAHVGPVGAGVIVLAGFVGMTVDSVLGALVEGRFVGNQSVNFLATLGAAIAGATVAVATGLVTI